MSSIATHEPAEAHGHPPALLDWLGASLSALCVVHCMLTPVLLALLPAFGAYWAHSWVHEALLFVLVPLAVLALGRGWLGHRRTWVLALGVAGMALIALPHLFAHGHGEIEWPLTIAGSILLVTAHARNLALCRCGRVHR